MKQKTFFMWSGIVFLVVAIAHAVRAFNGWSLTVNNYELPIWLSWVAVLFVGYMSYQGIKLSKRN